MPVFSLFLKLSQNLFKSILKLGESSVTFELPIHRSSFKLKNRIRVIIAAIAFIILLLPFLSFRPSFEPITFQKKGVEFSLPETPHSYSISLPMRIPHIST